MIEMGVASGFADTVGIVPRLDVSAALWLAAGAPTLVVIREPPTRTPGSHEGRWSRGVPTLDRCFRDAILAVDSLPRIETVS